MTVQRETTMTSVEGSSNRTYLDVSFHKHSDHFSRSQVDACIQNRLEERRQSWDQSRKNDVSLVLPPAFQSVIHQREIVIKQLQGPPTELLHQKIQRSLSLKRATWR